MGYLASVVGAVFVFVILRIIAMFLKKSDEDGARSVGRILSWMAVGILVVWSGFGTAFASIHQIPAGHVGVVYEFGAIKGQIGEGFNLLAPWRTTRDANIQVQGHKFPDLQSFSKETQDVIVSATLNIKTDIGAIQKLYREVGPNFFAILVEPRVNQNFKDETVKYLSVDIAPNREEIRKAVRQRLEVELAPYSIQVVDLLLDNIDFSEEFKNAIEAKQIATQRALEEEQKVYVSRYQANQAIEQARGQGEAILVVASKQAEANKQLAESLTPALVQYSLIQKLGDQIKVILMPASQQFILGEDFLKESPK